MIIVVTGAYGFIGSNIIRALNLKGFNDIIAVDNLTNGAKAQNLINCQILDFVDKEIFIKRILDGEYDEQIDYIFHQGACSNTTESDGKYMMKNNYSYSIDLLEFAQKFEIPLLYASSAAIYGAKSTFIEEVEYEHPLNIYGYSKFLFDQLVRRYFNLNQLRAPIVGLRYFNVYGRHEFHKDKMASVVLHNFRQYQANGSVELFSGCQGYSNGTQLRDFISVEDIVKINIYFFENHINDKEEISGIFNCGTGIARSFNDLALSTINACRKLKQQAAISLTEAVELGIIKYIEFPVELGGKYQCFTEANITRLRDTGYEQPFLTLEEGIYNYVKWLSTQK